MRLNAFQFFIQGGPPITKGFSSTFVKSEDFYGSNSTYRLKSFKNHLKWYQSRTDSLGSECRKSTFEVKNAKIKSYPGIEPRDCLIQNTAKFKSETSLKSITILCCIIISACSIFQKRILWFVGKSRGLIHYYTCVMHCFIDKNTKKMKLHQILFILSQFIFSCNFYYFLFWIMQRNNTT